MHLSALTTHIPISLRMYKMVNYDTEPASAKTSVTSGLNSAHIPFSGRCSINFHGKMNRYQPINKAAMNAILLAFDTISYAGAPKCFI